MFIKTVALFMSYKLVKLQKHVYVPRYMSTCTGMCIEPHICTLGSQCVNKAPCQPKKLEQLSNNCY